MICKPCARQDHARCEYPHTCPCQHRTTVKADAGVKATQSHQQARAAYRLP